MDSLRGNFEHRGDDAYDVASDVEDEIARQEPPAAIGRDERRMQVRAYNHWASHLGSGNLPLIEQLDPAAERDFAPFSVLLDFTSSIENPGIAYLGSELALECGHADFAPETLDDVPARSLLSRITDHHLQILANQAPIGFEAEFVNQRGVTILYRGILLPYSTDSDTIDFVYGVINWKEMADPETADALLLEIDQALDRKPEEPEETPVVLDMPMTDWADGPVGAFLEIVDGEDDEGDDYADGDGGDSSPFASLSSLMPTRGQAEAVPAVPAYEDPAHDELAPLHDAADDDVEPIDLTGWLESARACAEAARSSEDRSREALYDAVGRAYDFSLAADAEPGEFVRLIDEAGLVMQDRAPMTPVVKLVFGADYDKTRLTEYATALSHARRVGLGRGELATYLRDARGGLKGVVKAERAHKRAEAGRDTAPRTAIKGPLVEALRAIEPQGFDTLPAHGEEFALVAIRRLPDGRVAVLGEIAHDVALIERAARSLTG